MGTSDRLAQPFVRQYLSLADLVSKPPQALHNLGKARPTCLADLLKFFLKPCVVDVNIVAQDMNFLLPIPCTEPNAGDDTQTARSIASALVERRNAFDGIMVRDGDVAQSSCLCRLHNLLRGILPVGKGCMDMQVTWHRILLDYIFSRTKTRSICVTRCPEGSISTITAAYSADPSAISKRTGIPVRNF